MKEKFLNFFATIFLGVFLFIVFDVIAAPHKTSSKEASSFTNKFDKKFSGKAFAIDGDSIKVGKNEVRLVEIDAPEYSQNCFDAANLEYACGQISKSFTSNLVNGTNVVCNYIEKDKYDRFLAKCFVGEISVNGEILKNGMAVIYNFASAEPEMVALEAEAKKKRIGIWKGKFQLPKEYRKAHPRK